MGFCTQLLYCPFFSDDDRVDWMGDKALQIRLAASNSSTSAKTESATSTSLTPLRAKYHTPLEHARDHQVSHGSHRPGFSTALRLLSSAASQRLAIGPIATNHMRTIAN